MAKEKRRYRTAVVGCGKIGALFEAEPKREKPASHAGAAVVNDRTDLVALVDTNVKNLAAARTLFPGAANYTSLGECLKTEHLDIIIIATPPQTHLSLLKECVRFAVPIVICEKPLAASVKEAKQIEAIVVESSMVLVLNYQRRFSPLFARVRTDIRKGKLGRIQQITCYYSNGLYSNGGHVIDALAYVLNDDVASVIGIQNDMNKTHSENDTNVDALLTTKKGAKIVLQSFDQKEYGIHDLRIYGTEGNAILTDYGRMLIEEPARSSRFVGIRQLNRAQAQITQVPFSDTEGALAHAIECYEDRRPPISSVMSGLSVLRVLDAITKSARQGGKKIII